AAPAPRSGVPEGENYAPHAEANNHYYVPYSSDHYEGAYDPFLPGIQTPLLEAFLKDLPSLTCTTLDTRLMEDTALIMVLTTHRMKVTQPARCLLLKQVLFNLGLLRAGISTGTLANSTKASTGGCRLLMKSMPQSLE
ncbi:hypothetical protein H0H92_011207, partial [Tricholoma furcatifolium]